MDERISGLLSENEVGGTVSVAVLAIFYKVWRILKSDRKVDDLDNNERSFREELRKEISELRQEKQRLEEMNQKLLFELSELRATIKFCKGVHPESCPIFRNDFPIRPIRKEISNETS